MKRLEVIMTMLLLCSLVVGTSAKLATADTSTTPSLVISQLKVTSSNGQFVTLYNATNTALDMSKYQLKYFNNHDLNKATSSKPIALSGSLPSHGYYVVSDDNLLICYQLTVNSVSLGFSSIAGRIEVLALSQSGVVSPVLQDYVGWSRSTANGAQTLPANTGASLLRQPVDTQNNPDVTTPGIGSWLAVQPDPANACNLVTTTSGLTKINSGANLLLPVTPPPATVLAATADISDANSSSNVGLMAPMLSELLPNPLGSGNDSTDEFIEIYNANPVSFDLSGYSLRVGTAALHSFVFPVGSILSPQSFTAFYASSTGLSLSNTGGQAQLLDSQGTSISLTNIYGTANDGQAWALANGDWYWTITPTPGAQNVITQPTAKKTTTTTTTTLKTTATSNKTPNSASSTQATATTKAATDVSGLTPVHPWTLALVAAIALLYGAYEYRADLGNRIYQFRKYLRHRRADWAPTAWWRSHRTS